MKNTKIKFLKHSESKSLAHKEQNSLLFQNSERILKKLLFLILAIVILSPSVLSIGIVGDFIREPIVFQPGMIITREYTVTNYRNDAEIYTSGDLTEYVTISNLKDHGGYKTFKVTVNLPDDIEIPGLHTIIIGATEVKPPDAAIATIARIQIPIPILVLYPYKTAKFYRLSIPHINENETGTVSFTSESLTKQDMTGLWADISIHNFNNDLVRTIKTDTYDLKYAEKKTISTNFDSTGLVAGQHFAEAIIHWGEDNTTTLKSSFNIGELNIDIVNYTGNFSAGQINKLEIDIKSNWNGNINTVFAQLFVDDKEQTATQTYGLTPFESKTITGFLDLTYIVGGEHDLKIILNFDDQQTIFEDKIDVIGKPKQKPLVIEINMLTVMMILTIIVLIILVAILFFDRDKKK